MEVENSFSHSFGPERRLKFLTRKLDEISEILKLDRIEAGPKMDMFFHKLRGTAATFDFMELDSIAQNANEIKGKTDELFDAIRDCRKKIEELVAGLKPNTQATVH